MRLSKEEVKRRKVGRFTQRDSYLGETDHPISQNRYTYAWNNPNKYIDKSGNRPLTGEEGYDNSPEAYYQAKIMQYMHDHGVDWDTAEWAIANSLMHNEGPYKILAQDSYLRLYDKFGKDPGYKPPGGDSVVNITDEELANSKAAQEKLENELAAEIARAKALGLKIPNLSSLDIYQKLAYLRQLRKICDEIEAGHISVEDAQKQVDRIIPQPDNWGGIKDVADWTLIAVGDIYLGLHGPTTTIKNGVNILRVPLQIAKVLKFLVVVGAVLNAVNAILYFAETGDAPGAIAIFFTAMVGLVTGVAIIELFTLIGSLIPGLGTAVGLIIGILAGVGFTIWWEYMGGQEWFLMKVTPIVREMWEETQ